MRPGRRSDRRDPPGRRQYRRDRGRGAVGPRPHLAGQLTEDRAADARTDFADLTVVRYGHAALADRTWELRQHLTAYDATLVALAEALEVPLVTCDARTADAPANQAAVELYAGTGA